MDWEYLGVGSACAVSAVSLHVVAHARMRTRHVIRAFHPRCKRRAKWDIQWYQIVEQTASRFYMRNYRKMVRMYPELLLLVCRA